MGIFDKLFRRAAAQPKPQHTYNMLLFGAPGVGKGTFAKLIQKDFDLMQFSTGDYFRHIIKQAEQNPGDMDEYTK